MSNLVEEVYYGPYVVQSKPGIKEDFIPSIERTAYEQSGEYPVIDLPEVLNLFKYENHLPKLGLFDVTTGTCRVRLDGLGEHKSQKYYRKYIDSLPKIVDLPLRLVIPLFSILTTASFSIIFSMFSTWAVNTSSDLIPVTVFSLLGSCLLGLIATGFTISAIEYFDKKHNEIIKLRNSEINSKLDVVLPKTTRQIIKNAINEYKEVFILAEVPEWDVKLVPKQDPLVIGVKENVAYVLDKFDLTTLENYVSSEFVI